MGETRCHGQLSKHRAVRLSAYDGPGRCPNGSRHVQSLCDHHVLLSHGHLIQGLQAQKQLQEAQRGGTIESWLTLKRDNKMILQVNSPVFETQFHHAIVDYNWR